MQISIEPDYGTWYNNLASTLVLLKENEEAIKMADHAILLNPVNGHPFRHKGMALLN